MVEAPSLDQACILERGAPGRSPADPPRGGIATPIGRKGEKRHADLIGADAAVMKIATGGRDERSDPLPLAALG
jgi:hypothetical protein